MNTGKVFLDPRHVDQFGHIPSHLRLCPSCGLHDGADLPGDEFNAPKAKFLTFGFFAGRHADQHLEQFFTLGLDADPIGHDVTAVQVHVAAMRAYISELVASLMQGVG